MGAMQTGTRVAGYRIDDVLSDGEMGSVYRATRLSDGHAVALKILDGDLGRDRHYRARFRREARLQALVDDPHVVKVYEFGHSEHGPFFAMQLVRGRTLKAAMLDRSLGADESIRILAQVAAGLDAAHRIGVIHRDVKPQNILLGPDRRAYLADFGLTAPTNSTLTSTGQLIGTVEYISPEQARGETPTARSDVYALAAVLYECLTGIVPYDRHTQAAALYAHLTEPPPSPRERCPNLPAALDAVIARGMAKDPEQRHRSAGELIREAELALRNGAAHASVPGAAVGASA
jgi:serine/threonine protein kinase